MYMFEIECMWPGLGCDESYSSDTSTLSKTILFANFRLKNKNIYSK